MWLVSALSQCFEFWRSFPGAINDRVNVSSCSCVQLAAKWGVLCWGQQRHPQVARCLGQGKFALAEPPA